MYLQIFLLIILIGLSAFFSLAEASLLSVSRLKIMHLVHNNRKGAIVLKKLKDDPHRLLITLLVGNNIANISASAIATSLAISLFGNKSLGIIIGVMTFIILVVCEIIPKSIGTQYNVPLSLLISGPVWIMSNIIYPIIMLFDFIIMAFMRFAGLKKKPYRPLVTEEEIRSFVKIGEEEGTIKQIEKEMIERIFRFDNIEVKYIMTPKKEMKMLDTASTIKDFLEYVSQYNHSRFPVYEGHKDNIIGIVFLRELIPHIRNGNLNMPIKNIMISPRFVFETRKIDSLMRQFLKLKEHMAIVINYHGKVVGLVTLEDALEEIVGEIVDESERI